MKKSYPNKDIVVEVETEENDPQAYKLLCSGNADGLSDLVSKHLDKGYTLHGSPFVSPSAFCQAVVW